MSEEHPERAPDDPQILARDLSLGRFMDAWSQLEAELRFLLSVLSKAPSEAAFAIAVAIPDLGRMRELLIALGDLHFPHNPEDKQELKQICDYLHISGKYRNSIVHGQWIHTLGPEPGCMHWVRLYVHIDKTKEFAAALGWDKGAQEQYAFSVPRLEERARKARLFGKRIHAFANRIGTLAKGHS